MSERIYSETIYFKSGRYHSTTTGVLKEETEILVNRWKKVNHPLNFWRDPFFITTTDKTTQTINLREVSSIVIQKEAR